MSELTTKQTPPEACVCPYCGKRNTNELEPPRADMSDVSWEWECYDCGETYRAIYELRCYKDDEGQLIWPTGASRLVEGRST